MLLLSAKVNCWTVFLVVTSAKTPCSIAQYYASNEARNDGAYDPMLNTQIYCEFGIFREGFIFAHMRSFVKIKSSRIGEITKPFTDIGKSRPSCEFFTSQICVLTLFAKIKCLREFPNLQCQ